MKQIVHIAAFCAALMLASCGGGGGSGSGAGGLAQPLTAGVFTGNYMGPCTAMPNGTNYDTGAQLYYILMVAIEASSTASAHATTRFDFFENASCSGDPAGVLPSTHVGNKFTVLERVYANGGAAYKINLALSSPDSPTGTFTPGPTADSIIYGNVIRLKLPWRIFAGYDVYELWSLRGSELYEGNNVYDAQGFPTGLMAYPSAVKVSALPAMPPAPCPAQTVNWASNGYSCVGATTVSKSGLSQAISSTPATSTVGTASFTCSNGSWSAPANASCTLDLPTVVSCPVQTISWISGANTCSGTTPLTYAGNNVSVSNTTSGYVGDQQMSCRNDGTWAVWAGVTGSCSIEPPTVTDPLQLAQLKNCLACHTVTGAGYSADLPSFERIANFYRNSPPAPGVLEAKIKAGGLGTFSTTFPMPANPQVSDADLAILVPWILAQPQ